MKKLKLEDIQVTSFVTAPAEPQEHGTVHGQAKPPKPTLFITCTCQPTDPNLDCTYGCSRDTSCPEACFVIIVTDVDCLG